MTLEGSTQQHQQKQAMLRIQDDHFQGVNKEAKQEMLKKIIKNTH
jgi:hypothetical protein